MCGRKSKGRAQSPLAGRRQIKNTNKLIKARKRKTKNWLCCCWQQVYNVFFSFWFLEFFCCLKINQTHEMRRKKKQGKLHCAKYREESMNLSSSNEGPVRSISRISWYACLTWSITKTNYDLLISFEINTSSLCFYFLFLCHFISFVFQGKVSVSARSLLVSGFVKAI